MIDKNLHKDTDYHFKPRNETHEIELILKGYDRGQKCYNVNSNDTKMRASGQKPWQQSVELLMVHHTTFPCSIVSTKPQTLTARYLHSFGIHENAIQNEDLITTFHD
jgi:hypothetical protein